MVHTIRCDADADGEQCGNERFWPVDVAHHRELRAHLRKQGWRHTRDGRDLCPDHAARRRANQAKKDLTSARSLPEKAAAATRVAKAHKGQ
ncbi:hypothetical protein ACFC07_34875 [Streptomyces sp. NPDC056099]|uniref:hypothetical protein n=1 Tax=unclassified Streptomyces TaxID=2593676 RepID=UPI0035DB77DD